MTRRLATLITAALLAGCAGVQQVGTLGPNGLQVWLVRHNDFLTANRMLVVLGSDGEVAASTGGTTPGYGAVAAGLAGSLVMGAGVAYAGRSLSDAIRSASVGVTADGTVGVGVTCQSGVDCAGIGQRVIQAAQ